MGLTAKQEMKKYKNFTKQFTSNLYDPCFCNADNKVAGDN